MGCIEAKEGGGEKALHRSILGWPSVMAQVPACRLREVPTPSPREAPVVNEEVIMVSALSPPTPALTRSPTLPAPTLEPSLMAELRHLSPSAWAYPLGSDEISRDNEEYIEMGAKVRLTASNFSNKRLAKRLVDMILLP